MASGPVRNAPCPCGSGRKYKLCCLAADEARERAARAAAVAAPAPDPWPALDLAEDDADAPPFPGLVAAADEEWERFATADAMFRVPARIMVRVTSFRLGATLQLSCTSIWKATITTCLRRCS